MKPKHFRKHCEGIFLGNIDNIKTKTIIKLKDAPINSTYTFTSYTVNVRFKLTEEGITQI